ncbi:Bardet-Biedl syndrome 7 protein homolog [Bolinopsis microptera]|uniref:Bardet-Biedl syndrome 7 protein homolog n=1 Tax=Bolinopsis microptera TaxID=2820187 RepID=UPI003079DC0A
MEFQLSRIDLMTVGSTSMKSMKVLPNPPNAKKMVQRVAVADHSGVLTCFQMKRSETVVDFKTLPGPKVERLELGGAKGSLQEKIFVSSGSEVRGFTKRGKQFLMFETNLSDSIKSMFVSGPDLHITGQYIYNMYTNCQDTHFYLSCDKINDMIGIPGTGKDIFPVLGCQDRVLRVLSGSELLYEAEVPGSPETLALFDIMSGFGHNNLIYGTKDGIIGLCTVNKDNPCHRWEIANSNNLGGITAIDTYDVNNDGVSELVIARDDGTVEVYSISEGQPKLITSKNVSESITSIGAGLITSAGHADVVVATYPGHVISLTSQVKSHVAQNIISPSAKTKLDDLKKDIEDLKRQVLAEREKYQKSAGSDSAISAVVKFHVNDKFTLNPVDANYLLSIEIQMPIENVLLQCDVPIDLLDVERNSAVVSHSACDPEDKNYLLATYRCQANTTRLDVKVRSIEGQYGTLQVYITPRIQPKTCQLKQYQIKPLSLHRRTHIIDSDRPMNTLKLSGKFSLGEVHSWIGYCIPEVPDKCPSGESITMFFQSTFLDTQLECNYRQGAVEFRSDNISTISILKDVITKLATQRKIAVNITYELNEESIPHSLRLIHPKLDEQLLLAKKVQLIDALKELSMHEPNLDFLSPEYKDIILNADKLQAAFKLQPCHLERLYGMITDLYIDKFKFKGLNVKSKVPMLLEVLDNYELETLVDFFEISAV